jgi:hypothetical protein
VHLTLSSRLSRRLESACEIRKHLECAEWSRVKGLVSLGSPLVSPSRSWYTRTAYATLCGKAAPGYSKGVTNCDEYPYYSTSEGGPGASLENINGKQNALEGRLLQDFAGPLGCNLSPGDAYTVIPDTTDVLPSVGICIEP